MLWGIRQEKQYVKVEDDLATLCGLTGRHVWDSIPPL